MHASPSWMISQSVKMRAALSNKLRGSLGAHRLFETSPSIASRRAIVSRMAHPPIDGYDAARRGWRMLGAQKCVDCALGGGFWTGGAVDDRSSAGLSFEHVWEVAAVDWPLEYGEGLPCPTIISSAPWKPYRSESRNGQERYGSCG